MAQTLTPELTADLHARGYSVRAWGVYDDELMEHVCRRGADGMTVNFPDRLAALLDKTRGRFCAKNNNAQRDEN